MLCFTLEDVSCFLGFEMVNQVVAVMDDDIEELGGHFLILRHGLQGRFKHFQELISD